MRRISALIALTSALLLVLAACGGDGPQDLSFDLSVEHRELVPAGDIIVSQGDTVTLNVTVDEPGDVHLHGYDIKVAGAPGQPAVLAFTADATGRFGFMFHVAPDDAMAMDGEHADDAMAMDGEHTEGDEHADHDDTELDVVLGAVEVRP